MHIHNVDLHYHAGQERDAGTSLADYLDHAVVTGRVVLGLTDHYSRYGDPLRTDREYPYEQTLAGLRAYYDDVEALRGAYPGLVLLFAPELSSRHVLAEIPDEVLALADLFICETSFPAGTVADNTAAAVQRIEEVGRFAERTGKPAFIAHPFRSSVNHRLVKRDIEPWIARLEPRPDGAYSPEELERFFLLDIERLGDACHAYGVPLEINGNTHYRVRAANNPAPLQMLWAAYRLLQACGVEFVPGSDQHGFRRSVGRVGSYVPADCFAMLGLGVEDLGFLRRIGLPVATRPLKG